MGVVAFIGLLDDRTLTPLTPELRREDDHERTGHELPERTKKNKDSASVECA
jgi:hypothetical protein